MLVRSEFQRQRQLSPFRRQSVVQVLPKSEVSLYSYISKSAGKAKDKFMMPMLCFNVISGESRAGNLLGVFWRVQSSRLCRQKPAVLRRT